MAPRRDYAELALRQPRADFARVHNHPFLVGRANLRRPARPQLTGMIKAFDVTLDESVRGEPDDDKPLVLAILKVQTAFPSMITVGRTDNNDIALPDVTISRFHAFFRGTGSRLELGDAGSRNGTWLAGKKLLPKGPAVPVPFGEVVRFGNLTFIILDPEGCWDELHKLG
jgi:hypothetical protein